MFEAPVVALCIGDTLQTMHSAVIEIGNGDNNCLAKVGDGVMRVAEFEHFGQHIDGLYNEVHQNGKEGKKGPYKLFSRMEDEKSYGGIQPPPKESELIL